MMPGQMPERARDLSVIVPFPVAIDVLREVRRGLVSFIGPDAEDCELVTPTSGGTVPGEASRHDECADLADGLAAARGRWILTLGRDLENLNVVGRLWAHRQASGLVMWRRPASRANDARGWRQHFVDALSRRVLALPVTDVSTPWRLFRRSALAGLRPRDHPRSLPLETLVTVIANGWRVLEVDMPAARVPARIGENGPGSVLADLPRLWRLRNSVFSADYDERAFDSWIPLQRYWQRERYRIIMTLADRDLLTLDIGCGSSRIIQALPRAVGLDIQLKKLRRVQPANARLVQGTLGKLPFRDSAFEAIICSQVIEHVPHAQVDWGEMARILAPGGRLVVGTPDYATWVWPILEFCYDKVHPRGYVNEHINHYTAASLRGDLEAHGFVVTDTRYVGGGELIYRAARVASREPSPRPPSARPADTAAAHQGLSPTAG